MKRRPHTRSLWHPGNPVVILLGAFLICLLLAFGLVGGGQATALSDVSGHVWTASSDRQGRAVLVETPQGTVQRVLGLRVKANGQAMTLSGQTDFQGIFVVDRAQPTTMAAQSLDGPWRVFAVEEAPAAGCEDVWEQRLNAYNRLRRAYPGQQLELRMPGNCGSADARGLGVRWRDQ